MLTLQVVPSCLQRLLLYRLIAQDWFVRDYEVLRKLQESPNLNFTRLDLSFDFPFLFKIGNSVVSVLTEAGGILK